MAAMVLAKVLEPVVDLVFPPRCPLCGEGVARHGGLCTACWSALVVPGEPACARCSRPFADSAAAAAICAPCLADPPRHDGIAAATLYTEASRKLVLQLKHGGRIALAPLLARLMAARLPPLEVDESEEGWIMVPVPLHRWRLWRRGFNQSAELARELARQTGARLVVDGLVRHKQTPMLGRLGAKARRRALSGAIAAHPRRLETLKGARVVLVDDVLTSGATTNACVSALKRAGAQKVMIACFARVLDEALG